MRDVRIAPCCREWAAELVLTGCCSEAAAAGTWAEPSGGSSLPRLLRSGRVGVIGRTHDLVSSSSTSWGLYRTLHPEQCVERLQAAAVLSEVFELLFCFDLPLRFEPKYLLY